jgi:hypothetical protein
MGCLNKEYQLKNKKEYKESENLKSLIVKQRFESHKKKHNVLYQSGNRVKPDLG